jgi:hypothetical protein
VNSQAEKGVSDRSFFVDRHFSDRQAGLLSLSFRQGTLALRGGWLSSASISEDG